MEETSMTPEEILGKMKTLIAEQFALDEEEITMSTSFVDDIGADSIDLVELVMAMEEEFEMDEIEEDDLSQLKTVGDVVKYLLSKLN
jgi:acyl carrier protein